MVETSLTTYPVILGMVWVIDWVEGWVEAHESSKDNSSARANAPRPGPYPMALRVSVELYSYLLREALSCGKSWGGGEVRVAWHNSPAGSWSRYEVGGGKEERAAVVARSRGVVLAGGGVVFAGRALAGVVMRFPGGAKERVTKMRSMTKGKANTDMTTALAWSTSAYQLRITNQGILMSSRAKLSCLRGPRGSPRRGRCWPRPWGCSR